MNRVQRYLYKDKKPIGVVWPPPKKDIADIAIIGTIALSVSLVALAWWNLHRSPQMRISPQITMNNPCHTCGGI